VGRFIVIGEIYQREEFKIQPANYRQVNHKQNERRDIGYSGRDMLKQEKSLGVAC